MCAISKRDAPILVGHQLPLWNVVKSLDYFRYLYTFEKSRFFNFYQLPSIKMHYFFKSNTENVSFLFSRKAALRLIILAFCRSHIQLLSRMRCHYITEAGRPVLPKINWRKCVFSIHCGVYSMVRTTWKINERLRSISYFAKLFLIVWKSKKCIV